MVRMQAGTVATRIVVVLAAVLVAIIVLPSLVPAMVGDNNAFATVAERLLRGDRLYVDVWDNKDPLFYYAVAAARAVSPLAQILLEVVWVIVCCAAAFSIATWSGCSRVTSWAVAAVAVPLVVTGFHYEAGLSEVPAVAVALVCVALIARDRWLGAGSAVAVIFFIKVIMLPPVALGAVLILVLRRSRRGLVRGLIGLVVGLALILGILLARGELGGYAQMLLANVAYAEGDARGGVGSNTLATFWGRGLGWRVWVAMGAAVALIIVRPKAGRLGSPRVAELRALVGATLVGTLLVLLVTGKWPHHASYLALPIVLATVLAAHSLTGALGRRPVWLRLIAAGVAIVVLSGFMPQSYRAGMREAGKKVANLTAVSPMTETLIAVGRGTTLARVGTADELDPHAFALHQWSLVCPSFAQYPFQSYSLLRQTTDCLPRADTILVSSTAVPTEWPDWNRYLADTEKLLTDRYTCTSVGGDRVCVRRDLVTTG